MRDAASRAQFRSADAEIIGGVVGKVQQLGKLAVNCDNKNQNNDQQRRFFHADAPLAECAELQAASTCNVNLSNFVPSALRQVKACADWVVGHFEFLTRSSRQQRGEMSRLCEGMRCARYRETDTDLVL